MTQTTIVDAQGRVYRQIYGGGFEPPALVEPLKELVYGRRGNLVSVSGIVNRIRLFCTVYSPAADRYRFSYGIFVALIIGFASLAGMAFVMVRAAMRAYAIRRTG
jgi:protein SCO1/2